MSLGISDKALIQCRLQVGIISAIVAIGQKYLSNLSSTKTRKKTMNGKHRGIDKPGQYLTLNTLLFF